MLNLKNYEKTKDQFNKLDETMTDTDLLNAAKNMKLESYLQRQN